MPTTSFGEYRGLARSTNAVGRVQANMLMTRMNVKDFIIRGTEEEAERSGTMQRRRSA
jgi:methyl-accepting chemotaxis protein